MTDRSWARIVAAAGGAVLAATLITAAPATAAPSSGAPAAPGAAAPGAAAPAPAPAAASAGGASCAASPRIDGSFVQPWLIDGWSDAQLAAQFAALGNACITSHVLQWSADTKNATTVYPTSVAGLSQSSSSDVVGRVLAAADAAGVDEYVGLQVNDEWWSTYANDAAWLANEANLAIALANDLHATYGTHTSFAGWYLPFEVDNWNLTTPASWNAMANFYATVAHHLHALTPSKPVIVSPFFNTAGGLSASQWQSMWSSILATAPIDVIALQDGVGAGHATVSQLPAWFAATKNAITAARPSTQLWADTETFTPDFAPMPVGRIVASLNAVAPYVSQILAFSYDHYMSPLVVPAAYDATYRDYLASGAVEAIAPSVPASVTASASSMTSVNLSWAASSDNIATIGYRIYRNGTLLTEQPGTVTSFVDTGLAPATTYSYRVAAFDAAGNASVQSATAKATTLVRPTLLSAGKPYTSSLAADPSYPDSGSRKLTDSVTADLNYANAAWQGRNTGTPYSFTIDLGATKTITQVDSSWLQSKSLYIFVPKSIQISVSKNGSSFTPVTTLSPPALGNADQRYTFTASGLSASARYIRITVTPASNAWSFVDEAAITGY